MVSPVYDPQVFNSLAIVLKCVDYGDHDRILTLFTREKGKLSALAKNAKKSVKRFSGALELFYVIDLAIRQNSRMAYLMEASVVEAFENIRWDILKIAYASYWVETVVRFLEEGTCQEGIFNLLYHCLAGLNAGLRSPDEWSIYYHLKFLEMTGHAPELSRCLICGSDLDHMEGVRVGFDIAAGGLTCDRCRRFDRSMGLAKGTVKQLLWFQHSNPENASVIRFSPYAIEEGLNFLESFLTHHLENELRSLKFLRKTRERHSHLS